MFLVSKNDDFYTTDFPIVVEPHVKDARTRIWNLHNMEEGDVSFITKFNLMLVLDKSILRQGL